MDLPVALQFTAPAPTLLGREILALDGDVGTARLRFVAKEDFTNRHGSVHVGFVAAMLDSATSVALIGMLPDHLMSLTMRLETVYLKPTPIGELFVEAWVTERTDREATSKARLEGPDGTVFATAIATLRIRPKR